MQCSWAQAVLPLHGWDQAMLLCSVAETMSYYPAVYIIFEIVDQDSGYGNCFLP